MRRLAVPVLLAALLMPPLLTLSAPPARAQWVVIDPANLYQQILQYAQMLLDYYQQYEMLVANYDELRNLIEQGELMAQNLERLDELLADDPGRFLHGLRDLFYRLEGIVYTADDVLRRYDEVYAPRVANDLPEEEALRAEQTLATLRTLLAGTREMGRASEDASHRVEVLTRQLEGAEGNLEALEALGALTTHVATETTRAAEVDAMAVNALAAYFSHEVASRELSRRTFLDWVDRGAAALPEARRQFRPVPPSFGEPR